MHDDDATPRAARKSPTPVLRVTNATTTSSSTGSTAASVKISKFFTSGQDPPRPSTAPSPGGPPVLPPIPSLVSRVSSLHRRSAKDPDRPPAAPTPPPKITHTPPTPIRGGTSTGTVSASTSGSSSRTPGSTTTSGSSIPTRPGHSAKGSLDSNYRYRGAPPTMRAVAEEGSPTAPSTSPLPKGKSREPIPRLNGSKMSSSARATKHGSFDFERPGGWTGAAAMQRSGSGGTTGTSVSGASRRSGVEGARERESVYGPGLAGVGTLQREASMKRAQEREELLKRGRKDKDKDKDKDKERTRGSTSQRTTPDTVHASTSSASAANGKASSMGRAAGRRTAQFLPKRLVGLASAHHPPFPFEPAVPSPTWSIGTASTGTAHEVALPAARAEKERARLRDEKERARSGLFGRRRSGDRAPVPVPLPVVPLAPVPDSPGPVPISMPLTLSAMLDGAHGARAGAGAARAPRPSAGHRSGTKGRSLDLGLGLAWAPSKVREEALLPKSAFFARTASGGSASSRERGPAVATGAMGRTASGASGASARPGLGRSASVNQGERDVDRAKLGREVAEVFRNVLDGEGYKLFKNYVHQFDADEIPYDGPQGIVSRVENLLAATPHHLSDDARKRLMDKFVRIILQVV
ncbi:hypothetical protein HYPSUDRAFT_196217 [Hypholoma sublateritium FD-334 SS-4]|uniref:Uncharacterized protein n=1 Tax=Hypholoma sublateritium (strain FD-334 SS-4) TaxID=945553 RepID=A0A0D2PNX4_HYPSF|nr:hypothetical protein HYPSUDRAFT_196217 [Hypholoma sublateritium FD-334 SS-4]